MGSVSVVIIFIAIAAVIVYVLPGYFNDDNKKIRRYRKLKSDDINRVPDEELESAVTEWLFAKMDNKGTTEVSIVNALPKPCKYFYSIYVVTEEICNGGFAQCYINSTRFFMKSAQHGFRDIGADKLENITAQANDIFDEYIKEHEENVASLAGICANSKLDELTEEFKNCEDLSDLSTLVIDYIRKNAEYFGD